MVKKYQMPTSFGISMPPPLQQWDTAIIHQQPKSGDWLQCYG